MSETVVIQPGRGSAATRPIDVVQIERELDRLWENLNQASDDTGGVTRASMSNVMIFCDRPDRVDSLIESIALLVERHPARVLLLVASGVDGVTAEVSAQCRRVGGGVQLCCEFIIVHFAANDVDRVASVIRPLLIGDLPTALWWACPEPPATQGELFDVLADLSDQIIYDSVGWPNPAEGVQAMARWVIGREQTVFNLAWRRLKAWRRLIAQVMDPAIAPGALGSVDHVEIEHGPHALSMAWLLTGWLAARLGWVADQGKVRSASEVAWGFNAGNHSIRVVIRRLDRGEPRIEALRMRWSIPNGENGSVAFDHTEEERLRVVPDESSLAPAVIPYHVREPEAMVAAQLAHRARDPLFENALAVAQTMAGVLR